MLLRNPWGSYGRSYTTQPRAQGQQGAAHLEPVAVQEQAESWVELTDLGRNFHPLEYGGAVEAGPRQAHMQNLAANLAAQRQKMGFQPV